MRIELQSPCKINLILNILGKRADGFHELETVMHPVGVYDRLTFDRNPAGIELSCSDATLPTDGGNLVVRAAELFFRGSGVAGGVRIHLEKRIPLAAGLGGGSGNAATTLRGLNELYGHPLTIERLGELAAALGSDVPFFLQDNPALAVGRGEKVEPLEPFSVFRDCYLFLVHPGFGVSTPWAYKNLARFPDALNGQRGRAQALVEALRTNSADAATPNFFNSLERPVLEKFPLLAIFQEFLREQHAWVTLMSGSGSTTFAIFREKKLLETAQEKFREKFGPLPWTASVPME